MIKIFKKSFQIQPLSLSQPASKHRKSQTSANSHKRWWYLTFNADDMFAHLLLQQRVMYHINEVIQRIDTWVDALESLDLVSDCHGIGMCSGRLSVRRVGRPTSCVHSRPVSLLLQVTTSLIPEPPSCHLHHDSSTCTGLTTRSCTVGWNKERWSKWRTMT